MTDKPTEDTRQDTHTQRENTQKAGELQGVPDGDIGERRRDDTRQEQERNGEEHGSRQTGRTHRRQNGTSHGDGDTIGHSRRHTAATEHTTGRNRKKSM